MFGLASQREKINSV